MMYAARTQRSPRLPCTQTLRPLRVPTVWQPDERAEKLLKIIGSSFRDYTERPSSVLQLENRFSMLLGTLSELCAALDHSQRLGMKVFEDPHVFIGNCDWVSHSLLSMPSFLAENNEKSGEDGGEANSSSSPSLDATLSEICRLGALMYIDMAIYPTPPQAGVKNKLSQLLFPLLRSLVETESLEGHSLVADLVLWGTMMGAISARSTELQDSYIDFIADNRIGRLRSWEEIGPRLLSFLWLNSVFDELARQLWHQAEQIAEPAEDG